MSFDEIKSVHPELFDLKYEQTEKGSPTKIRDTVQTYRKIYNLIKKDGFSGKILDAGSGYGDGTLVGRTEFGFIVDDIEPFPIKDYKPKYTDYLDIKEKYDVIISNAVLNVLPQDLRDAMVLKIGELLKPSGKAYINVRNPLVRKSVTKIVIDDDNMEYYIRKTKSYQKGFRSRELSAYLRDVLGDGFVVKPTKKFGVISAIVIKLNTEDNP